MPISCILQGAIGRVCHSNAAAIVARVLVLVLLLASLDSHLNPMPGRGGKE